DSACNESMTSDAALAPIMSGNTRVEMSMTTKLRLGRELPAPNGDASGATNGDRATVPITSYRDLRVWQHAMDLVIRVYHLTSHFPKSEVHALTADLQRSSVSVAAHIAEGHGCEHLDEFLHHLSIAAASLRKVETLMQIVDRLAYLPASEAEITLRHCDETGRMLTGLTKSLRRKQ
ncbi:MAG: four helix bundle protein, partial [Gemmatimonadota bacterium]|nr:four helix bundle protein [Gemmatimonadota bacterium]